MEVWQETFNLDFLSEFEFVKSTEETTANNDAVVPNSDLQQTTLTPNNTQQQQIIPTISIQEPEVENNTENDTTYDDKENYDDVMYQNNNNTSTTSTVTSSSSSSANTSVDYEKDEQLLPWHLIIDELNRYNWQQDSENRVKLLLSHFETENPNSTDMKPNYNNNNENSLQIKEEINVSEQNLEWNSNEMKLQLKTEESNLLSSDSSYLTMPNYTSQIYNNLEENSTSSTFLNLQRFKEEIPAIENDDSNSTMRNLMELDEMCSQIAAQSQEEPIIVNNNTNGILQNWQDNWQQQNVITNSENLDASYVGTNSLVENQLFESESLQNETLESVPLQNQLPESPPLEYHPSTTVSDYNKTLEQVKEWEKVFKDAANERSKRTTTEESWNIEDDDDSMQQGGIWQHSSIGNNDQPVDMELLLSQLQGDLLITPNIVPEEVPENEDMMREQRLPDWNTAFGHTRPVSIEDDFPSQPCDLFYNKDTAQDLCQVQSPDGVDLQPSPIPTETSIEENTERVVSSPPVPLAPIASPPPSPPTSNITTSQLETTSVFETPEPTIDNTILEQESRVEPTIPAAVKTAVEECQKLLQIDKSKPKKSGDPCQFCGKSIINLNRHFMRVHNMKKVNGVFVPFNVYHSNTPDILKNTDTSSKENNNKKSSSVNNTKKSIETKVSDHSSSNKNKSPSHCNVSEIKKPIVSSINMVREIIPETTNVSVLPEKPPVLLNTQQRQQQQQKPNENSTDIEKCICALCNKVFKGKLSMTKHMKTIHKITQSILKCKRCPYTSIYPYVMRNHIVQKHTFKPSFMCIYCDLTYKGREGVKHHIKTKHIIDVQTQFGDITLDTIGQVIMLCKVKCHNSSKKDIDKNTKQSLTSKACCTTVMPSKINFLLPPSTVVSRVKELNTAQPSKNVNKASNKKNVLENKTKISSSNNIPIQNCTEPSIEATLSNPDLTVSVVPFNTSQTCTIDPNSISQTLNQDPIEHQLITGPKRKAPTKPTGKIKNKRLSVCSLNSDVSISLEVPQIDCNDVSNVTGVTQNMVPNVSLFPITYNDNVNTTQSEINTQTSIFGINNSVIKQKRKLSGTISVSKRSRKLTSTMVSPDSIPSSSPNTTTITPLFNTLSPFVPSSIEEINQYHSSQHDLNPSKPYPEQEYTITSNPKEIISSNIDENPYLDPPNSISPSEIIDKLTNETSTCNPDEIENSCYSTIPDYLLSSNEMQSYVINSPCQNPEPDSTSEIVNLPITPSTSCNNNNKNSTYTNYVPSPTLLVNKNEMLSSTYISNVNSPTVSYSNNDYNFLPIDYTKKHIDPISPLSPPSSCLSPSVSLLPPSESCSSYTSIHSSELDAVEADSQKETSSSFTYNDPSSNHSSTTSSNNSNKAIDFSSNNNSKSKRGEYPCKNCYKRFNSQNELNLHKSTVHNNLDKPFSCSICAYKFAHNAYLKRHMKTHETFKCSYCYKKFVDQFLCESHELADHDDLEEEGKEEEKSLIKEKEIVEKDKNIKSTKKIIDAQSGESKNKQTKTIIVDNIIDDTNMIDWDNNICNICNNCDYDSSQNNDFYAHLYYYHLYTPYLSTQCLFCKKNISKKQYLRKHLKNIHKLSFAKQ